MVESELLAGNPLGDPATRPLYVYVSPGVHAGDAHDVASVYVLQGFTGQLDKWHNRTSFEPNSIERLDAMFHANPGLDAIVVFVDAWTSLGGSQFLNSPATGRYMDYLCAEIVSFVDAGYPTRATRDARGITGHSSGGYGAIVTSMLRPDLFGAFASHAGDSLFEIFIRDFVEVARVLRDRFDGSIQKLRTAAAKSDPFDWGTFGTAVSIYAYAAAYSPDVDNPGGVLLPFDERSGELIPEVWDRWLALDPVRMASRHGDQLRSMRRIYLDAGRGDDYLLDVGTQAFSHELSKLDVEHTFELFDGRHSGISHRYPGAIRELVEALA